MLFSCNLIHSILHFLFLEPLPNFTLGTMHNCSSIDWLVCFIGCFVLSRQKYFCSFSNYALAPTTNNDPYNNTYTHRLVFTIHFERLAYIGKSLIIQSNARCNRNIYTLNASYVSISIILSIFIH